MRKSLIITVVIVMLCLCGCEAVVAVPESLEPTKASEMLLTTTAAEESTDKLEATTTSSVEIDVPEKNEEESGTPTEDVASVDNKADLAEKNVPVSSESTAPSFEEVKADKPSEQAETQLPAPSEPPKETEQSKPTEQPVATERDDAPAEVPAPTEPPATTEPPIPAETEPPVETQPKTAYDYEFDINAIRADCIAIGQSMGYTLNTHGAPVIVSLIMSIVIGFCFGCFNGYLVAFVGVPPFIVSMATMNIAKGLGSVFTKTQSVSWPQGNDPTGKGWFRNLVKVGDFPVGLLIFAVAVVILYIVMNNTKAGRYILCLGSNKEAVRLSGVNVRKWQMLAYVICGALVGIAAIFFVGAYTTVQPGLGDTYNNEAIASCVMGGTSMAGGLASIGGTVIGVLVISLLQEGIMALRMTKEVQMIITGIIVIVFVYADVSARRRRN